MNICEGMRVKVKSSNKRAYYNVIGRYGTVQRISVSSIGVVVDGLYNHMSSTGLYWFAEKELKVVDNESERDVMKDFKNVAIVNLLDDYNKKDYAFALYDEEMALMIDGDNALVVVNARHENNRILGFVKEIMSTETYYSIDKNKNNKITAEVVGVVNMDGYLARKAEKERLKELAKKKAAIEKELEAEINKRKSVEYYEEMAKKYSDNPKLMELVAELKSLSV